MTLYVFLYLALVQLLFITTWYYTPKLTAYKDNLYNFKHKVKKREARLFSFLPKIKTKELYIKVLKLGAVASIIFFITFIFNFTDTSSVYYDTKDSIQSISDFEKLNPFANANTFLLIIMYLAFFIKTFAIIVSLVTLFDKVLLILLHKIVSFIYRTIKNSFLFIFKKFRTKQS